MKIIHLNNDITSDTELIAKCRKQNSRAQEQLFRKYAGMILTTARRYESQAYSAKDLMQDAFIIIFRKIKTYDPQKGKLINWMIRVTINNALNTIRKQKLSFTQFDHVEHELTEENFEVETSSMTEEQILQCISKLPTGYRTVFSLYVIDGYTHAEIAEILDITTTTSRTQLLMAKKKLRQEIQEVRNIRYGTYK